MNKEPYTYNGFQPKNEANCIIIRAYATEEFDDKTVSNYTEKLISDGYKFEIVNKKTAILHINKIEIKFIRVKNK